MKLTAQAIGIKLRFLFWGGGVIRVIMWAFPLHFILVISCMHKWNCDYYKRLTIEGLQTLDFKIKRRIKLKMQTRSGTQVTIRLVRLLFL